MKPITIAAAFWADERRRFAVLFTALAGGLLAFYYFPRGDDSAVERFTREYLRAYTRMLSIVLAPFDPGVQSHGNLLIGRFSMQIVKSCDAMEANILFAAALLAVAAPWRRKAAALVAGLAALVAFNLVRLVVLYWTGIYAAPAFDFFHYEVWPLAMIVFATIDFLFCARWLQQGPGSIPTMSTGHAAR
jgi:exosortase/archaeosortase family protein